MRYADEDFYAEIYPNDDVEDAFDRLSWDASAIIDRMTTGVDGIKKLKLYPPTDDDDAEAVNRCACALVHTMFRLEQMEKAQEQAAAYVKNEDGTMQSALVASRSAGNESISYSGAGDFAKSSSIAAAVADPQTREKLYRDTVRDYLSGVHDANGVNLLYIGGYPRV